MSSRRDPKQSKIMRYMKGPFQVLAGAGNLCVQSLTGGGGVNISYGNAMGCPTPRIPTTTLPRSSGGGGANSSKLRDLVRPGAGNVKAELGRSKCSLPRKKTVAFFGRIDEEKPFDFGGQEEYKVGLLGGRDAYPKSRSCYASISRKTMVA